MPEEGARSRQAEGAPAAFRGEGGSGGAGEGPARASHSLELQLLPLQVRL